LGQARGALTERASVRGTSAGSAALAGELMHSPPCPHQACLGPLHARPAAMPGGDGASGPGASHALHAPTHVLQEPMPCHETARWQRPDIGMWGSSGGGPRPPGRAPYQLQKALALQPEEHRRLRGQRAGRQRLRRGHRLLHAPRRGCLRGRLPPARPTRSMHTLHACFQHLANDDAALCLLACQAQRFQRRDCLLSQARERRGGTGRRGVRGVRVRARLRASATSAADTLTAPQSTSRATAAAVSQWPWCCRYPNTSSPSRFPACAAGQGLGSAAAQWRGQRGRGRRSCWVPRRRADGAHQR